MKRSSDTHRVFIETFAIIVAVEMAIMLLLPLIAPELGSVQEAVLDTVALALIAGPLVLWRGLAAARRSDAEQGAGAHSALRTVELTVAIALVLGVGGSAFGAWKTWQGIHASSEARLELLAERVQVETERRLQSHAYGLRGARGSIISNRSITRAGFVDYLASRDLASEFPGASGFGYIERVARAELQAYTAAVRAADDPRFTIRSSGDLPDLYVTRWIEPPAADRAFPGWDVATDAVRRATAERAMLTGADACSTLPGRGAGKSPDLICYLPVFRAGASASTPDERRRDLVGWVYVPARIQETLARVDEAASGWLDVEVYDGPATTSASLLYASGQHSAGESYQPIELRGRDRLHLAPVAIRVAGLEWTLLMAASPEFEAEMDDVTPFLVGAGGVFVSSLLALLFWTLGSGRQRALALARAMTQELQASEAEAVSALARLGAYRATLDRHAIVSVTDKSGTIIEVNELFCGVSGYSRGELIGADHRILDTGRAPRSFWLEMMRRAGQGEIWRAEVCNKSKGGALYWVDLSVGRILDAAGKISGLIAVGVDISELKRSEKELVEARDAASAASRAKSEFLANMSHEIRTPLTAILGYADMLSEAGGIEPSRVQPHSQAVDTIRSAGRHLLAIINDILDLSKIEAGKTVAERVEVALVMVLREVEGLMRPRAASKGVALEVRLDTPLPERVMSDPTRLRQILMNLIGNAIKFTHAGRVTVVARAEPGAGPSGGARLVIDVEDTGPGLTPEQERKLFAPFSQADTTVTRQYGGTGLGLTICRRLAALMDGSVTLARTAPGEGSRFRIDLPLVAAPGSPITSSLGAAQMEDAAGVDAAQTQLAGRILLAEDGPDNQRLIRFLLERAGADVTVAGNGRIALEMLEGAAADDEPFDLLLTDIQMPEMDGYTLARTLRERGSALPIVALTAHAMAEDRQRCVDAGCDDYASKPIDKPALLATCARWMGKSARDIAAS